MVAIHYRRIGVQAMKQPGFIQPTPETAQLWIELAEAKHQRDIKRIGALSAQIRTETVRNAQVAENERK